MNPTQTETVRQIVWDGPIGLPSICLGGIALVVLFTWSLGRERSILGNRATFGFAALRLIAIGTVVWMLLSPSRVTVQTSSTRKSIVVLQDVSGSMQTVDPLGTADEARWLLATTDGVDGLVATRLADDAVAAVDVASKELQAATSALSQHLGERAVDSHRLAAAQAIERTAEHVDALPSSLPMDPIGAQVRRAQDLLASSELESFRQRCALLAKGKATDDKDLQDQLTDLRYRVIGLRNVLQTLSRECATYESVSLTKKTPELLQGIAVQTRGQRVAAALNQLDVSVLNAIGDEVDIHYLQFDRAIRRVSGFNETGLKPGLEQAQTVPKSRSSDSDETLGSRTTNLTAALQHLREIQQSQPIAAAFLVSDIAHNENGVMRSGDVDGEELEGEEVESTLLVYETNVPEPTEFAATLKDLPIYTVPIGNPQRRRDVELIAVEAPPIAMRNDDIVIQAHLQAHRCEGDRCLVELIENTEVVGFREVVFDSDFVSRTVRFDRRVSKIGEQKFQVSVTPIDGESTTENNFGEVDVNVTRNDIKVLLADEMPRWEFRYLAQLFRRDPKVDHDEMLFRPRVIATGRREESGQFPITESDWDQYDVVILGDLSPGRLPIESQEALARYLRRRGGTVVIIAGTRGMPHAFADSPLETILPVKETLLPVEVDDYAFQITEAGSSHVAMMVGQTQQATRDAWNFVNRFAPLHEVSRWRTPLPTATSLISVVPRNRTPAIDDDASDTTDETFLCWQSVGRGRVVYLSGPDTYRLRFLRGDQIHYRFWGQLLRWAIASDLSTGSQYVRVRASKSRYDTRETARVEVRLFDDEGESIIGLDSVGLRLDSAAGQAISQMVQSDDRPGVYVADLQGLAPGVYRAIPTGGDVDPLIDKEVGQDVGVSFTVAADIPREMADTRSDPVLARQIATLTGGQVLPPASISEVLELTDLSPIVTEKMTRTPIWAQWKYLWIVFGCLQTEWIVRKWRGLS